MFNVLRPSAVYGCASARRPLRRAEILQTDILRRVIVGIHFIAALLETEPLLCLAVLTERCSALGTPLARVRRVYLFDREVANLDFVLGVRKQTAERPCVELLGVRYPITNLSQVLKRNCITAVLNGFRNEFFRDGVEEVIVASRLGSSDRLDSFVIRPRSTLLKRAWPLLEFSVPVVQL